MPEDQAEVMAQGQSDLYERLVTKEHFEFTLSNELEKLRLELKNDIDRVQANFEKVRAELKHELETKTELKHGIKEMAHKLTIKLGAIVVIGITVLSVLDKLF